LSPLSFGKKETPVQPFVSTNGGITRHRRLFRISTMLPLSLGKKVAERNSGEIKRTNSRPTRLPKIPDRLGESMMKNVRNLNPRD
jgi:hypothetical protein